ncbi:MAG: KEOPS complex subunit Pcc1 [Promethearchaeota archaeon]
MEDMNKRWKINSTISLNMRSEENSKIFLRSFKPEMKSMPMKRCHLFISIEGKKVNFQINALDVNAFRSTINSILQFCNVVDTLLNFIEQEIIKPIQ